VCLPVTGVITFNQQLCAKRVKIWLILILSDKIIGVNDVDTFPVTFQ